MSARASRSGFTLIDLMIVVSTLAIITSVATPHLMAALLSANESAAISTLRSLNSAQAQVRASGAIDTDGDGSGEYGCFGELSGAMPCRVNVGGFPAAGVPGVDELNPPVLPPAFGLVNSSTVTHSGYHFQIWLPDESMPPQGMAEDGFGGFSASFPGSNHGEVLWNAYAWPVQVQQTGHRAFFVNQSGRIYQCRNQGTGGAPIYSGTTFVPWFDSALQTANMGANVGNTANPSQDTNVWVPVR
jgi:type II secretory pathway pseudopilin PulG